jgi:hypothetical protein
VLLLGKSVIAPIGWLTKLAPSTVLFQPSSESSVSVWMTGRPDVVTTVVKVPSTGTLGVTISLCTSPTALPPLAELPPTVFSIRVNVAGAPFTVTASTLYVLLASVLVVPWKSKENDESGAPVVLAVIVVVESDSVVVAATPLADEMPRSILNLMS